MRLAGNIVECALIQAQFSDIWKYRGARVAEIEKFSEQNSNSDRQSTARGLRYVSHAQILTPPFWIRDGLEVQQHTVIEREEVQQLIVAWILGWQATIHVAIPSDPRDVGNSMQCFYFQAIEDLKLGNNSGFIGCFQSVFHAGKQQQQIQIRLCMKLGQVWGACFSIFPNYVRCACLHFISTEEKQREHQPSSRQQNMFFQAIRCVLLAF